MKTYLKSVFITIFLLISTLQSALAADVFQTKIRVTADDNGVVVIEGGEGIVRLTQFCPDSTKDGCKKNVLVERVGNSFTLDKEGLADFQNAFDFNNASGDWLLVPDSRNITIDKNVGIEKSKNGSYFIYTGSIPKAKAEYQ